jgi:chitin synthase
MGLVIYNLAFIYLGFAADGIDFTNFNQMSILAVAGVSIGGFALLLIMHFFTHPRLVCRMICDSFSYWYYQGAYQHTLVVNSFCNVDDVSWGTKGSTSKHGGKGY